jgi:N-acetylneuraminic acid mutarotase
MGVVRSIHSSTLLGNGKVLVVGGQTAAGLTAEVYDPATGTWSRTGSLSAGRYGHTATLLHDGRVLVTGGDSGPTALASATVEVYDPTSGLWTGGPSMAFAGTFQTATLLPDGSVLVAGGRDDGGLRSAEVYDPVMALGRR